MTNEKLNNDFGVRPNVWPLQRECDEFYGNPRGANGRADPRWVRENLVDYSPPWRIIDEDSKEVILSFKVHKKCVESLTRVMNAIWNGCGQSQEWIDSHHLHWFSGSWVFRNIRDSSKLSMHSYGIALDFAASLNGLGEPWSPTKGVPLLMIEMFEREGWTWGGRWQGRPDAMHFQAARVTGTPLSRTISKGSKGPEVVRLQQLLDVEADGDFGDVTHIAVIKFQQEHGLKPDGVVGDATWKALNA